MSEPADSTSNEDKWKNKAKKRKKKIQEYKRSFPRSAEESEKTGSKTTVLKSGFIPEEYRNVDTPTVGQNTVYETTAISRDDRNRFEHLLPQKGIISNKFTKYSPKDVIVVDLTNSENIFIPQKYAFGKTLKDNIVPSLSGVSPLVAYLNPPADKRNCDYLEDIKTFGIGNEKTRIAIELGQVVNRASCTSRHLALNQCFLTNDQKFWDMNPAGTTATTYKEPKIVMFSKKFNASDPEYAKTASNAEEIYDNIMPSKSDVEKFMKVYASSPVMRERIDSLLAGSNDMRGRIPKTNSDVDIGFSNPNTSFKEELLLNNFQNLQITEDMHQMMKHMMMTVYITMVSTLTDYFLMTQHASRTLLSAGNTMVVTPGLMTPVVLHSFFKETAGICKGLVEQTAEELLSSEDKVKALYHTESNSLVFLNQLIYNSFVSAEESNSGLFRDGYTLKVDGYRWINDCTPNGPFTIRTGIDQTLTLSTPDKLPTVGIKDAFKNSSEGVHVEGMLKAIAGKTKDTTNRKQFHQILLDYYYAYLSCTPLNAMAPDVWLLPPHDYSNEFNADAVFNLWTERVNFFQSEFIPDNNAYFNAGGVKSIIATKGRTTPSIIPNSKSIYQKKTILPGLKSGLKFSGLL